MKNRIIILFGLILCIITVSKTGHEVVNQSITNNDIVINYPIFYQKILDEKIKLYINDLYKQYQGGILEVDYDYEIKKDQTNINFYIYENINNKVTMYNDIMIHDHQEQLTKFSRVNVSLEQNVSGTSSTIDPSKPMVAFTFDDGPNYNTSKIIDVLIKHGKKATFFVMGNRIKGQEGIIMKMKETQMEIGNHTYSHKQLTLLSEDKIKYEINTTDELILSIIGNKALYLRPSYGITNNRVKKIVQTPIILWSLDTLDWKYHNSTKIVNKIMNKVKDGDIILMHDIYRATVNAVDEVIPKLEATGFQIVTVSELFYYKGITPKIAVSYGRIT